MGCVRSANLPAPQVIAAEIAEDRAACPTYCPGRACLRIFLMKVLTHLPQELADHTRVIPRSAMTSSLMKDESASLRGWCVAQHAPDLKLCVVPMARSTSSQPMGRTT